MPFVEPDYLCQGTPLRGYLVPPRMQIDFRIKTFRYDVSRLSELIAPRNLMKAKCSNDPFLAPTALFSGRL